MLRSRQIPPPRHTNHCLAGRPRSTGPLLATSTNPHTLFLSLAATVCAFALVLVVIASQASSSATPVVETATVPSTVSVVAQEFSHAASVTYAVALDPAASR